MMRLMPNRFLKKDISFWKKPAFDVIVCEAVISLPSASFIAVPFESTSFAVLLLAAHRMIHLTCGLTFDTASFFYGVTLIFGKHKLDF